MGVISFYQKHLILVYNTRKSSYHSDYYVTPSNIKIDLFGKPPGKELDILSHQGGFMAFLLLSDSPLSKIFVIHSHSLLSWKEF